MEFLRVLFRSDEDIFLPHMFYQIIISEHGATAFLFTHEKRVGTEGCLLTDELEDCIVKVEDVEAVTGLDFFKGLGAAAERRLQGTDGRVVWKMLVGGKVSRSEEHTSELQSLMGSSYAVF